MGRGGEGRIYGNVPNQANTVGKETSEIIAMVSKMYIGMIIELNMAAATKSSGW